MKFKVEDLRELIKGMPGDYWVDLPDANKELLDSAIKAVEFYEQYADLQNTVESAIYNWEEKEDCDCCQNNKVLREDLLSSIKRLNGVEDGKR